MLASSPPNKFISVIALAAEWGPYPKERLLRIRTQPNLDEGHRQTVGTNFVTESEGFAFSENAEFGFLSTAFVSSLPNSYRPRPLEPENDATETES
jgi:hypothetical protein